MITRSLRYVLAFLLSLAVLVAGSPSGHGETNSQVVKFNRDIRPILSENCFQCHGPDGKHREADLRLDQVEGVAGVFEPSDLKESEAWKRITSTDDDERMPPPKSHKELKQEQIQLIRRWIEQGAKAEGHWAFIPPEQPPLPQVQDSARVQNAIDAFVLARLEKEGLGFSPEADRERLMRRVTLDLTGLPPTIAEIDAFTADTSPDAYEKLVDRLLRSERFGERMVLAWMDAARYGDSSVFHADGPRDMWPWRDWAIRAYNENKSFDQFTVEQLAGDLLPDATLTQKIATGFNRNNASTDEGGAIAEEYRVEYAVDRVKTTSMVWLGLTLECGQCHDHKYDPITQHDYYRFFAYFNQASDPGMQSRGGNQAPVADVPDFARLAQIQQAEKRIAQLEEQIAQRAAQVGPEFDAWLAQLQAKPQQQKTIPGDLLLHYALDETAGDAVHDAVDPQRSAKVHGNASWSEGHFAGALGIDGSNFADLGDVGNFQRSDAFSYGAWIKPQGAGSGAPIARMDDRTAYRGYDLYLNGGQVSVHIIHSWPTNAIKVTTKNKVKPDAWQHIFVTYDGSSKAAGIQIYIDGQPQEWSIEQDGLRDTIQTDKPLYLGRRNPGSPFRGLIDDVRFYHRKLSDTEVAALAGSDVIADILAVAPAQRTAQQLAALQRHYLETQDEAYGKLRKELTEAKRETTAANQKVSTVMVMQDVPQMRMTYVLDRGNYASPNKDKPVQPGTPSVLPPPPADAPGNRLGMARWLVQPGHPLTARVAVNRYWYMLFGTGLVKTLEDFGSQGEWPSHPELLDWLAVDFVENGWDIKRSIRQMVLSTTYRQSSRVTRALYEKDPENRLLARGPRFRLQGEFIRDNALAASGLLVEKIGGPSVKPYQPPGLWNEVSLDGNVRFVQDHGDNLYRRSMYTYWKRSAPAPGLTIFDAPSREKCTVRRSRTNTPLQALVTLNDPQFVEAARALAQRALKEGGTSPTEQILYAYRLATGVRPRPATLEVLSKAYAEELETFRSEQERALKLLAIGEAKRDESLDAAQHAAMAIVASMILNLDETLTRG